jgi:hypothetical protein
MRVAAIQRDPPPFLPPRSASTRPLPRPWPAALLMAILVLALSACGWRSSKPDGAPTRADPGVTRTVEPPQVRSRDAVPAPADPGASEVLFNDPGAPPVFFSQDPELLRAEVSAECRSNRPGPSADMIPALVNDLYLSVVDPAEAAEALIRGDCAPVPVIVRELVLRGGQRSIEPVVGRAIALSPPNQRAAIEAAAVDGLARHSELIGLGAGPTRRAREVAMAYYPSAGPPARAESATTSGPLYRAATPGYGIYSFVLVGGSVETLADADRARHRELFRLIETYAAVGGEVGEAPHRDAHVFLVPVDEELAGAPLFNQVSSDLSDRMRLRLIEVLRGRGLTALAARLESGTGPFLVAGLEPDLLSGGAGSPRLIADLSALGVEHIYAVVDGFDREVSSDLVGRPESIAALYDRLVTLLPAGQTQVFGSIPLPQDWLFIVQETSEPGTQLARDVPSTSVAGSQPEQRAGL